MDRREPSAASYRFQCDLCSGPDWRGDDLESPPLCPKCGRLPVRYVLDNEPYCWVHRKRLVSSYRTSSAFLLIDYVWRGHERSFPNAKLYTVPDEQVAGGDEIVFSFCEECQRTYESSVLE